MSLRRKLSILCLTLLVLFLIVSRVPLIPSARASTSEWLSCNAYDSTYATWSTVGTSPYLDAQDEPNNYIYDKTPASQMGWFDFPSTSITSGTIKANISIYCWCDDGSDWAEVYVDYTGTGGGTNIGNVGQHVTKQYDTIDLGTHTVSEINNLRVYFVYQKVGGAVEVYIDHVRIGIRPAIDTVQTDKSVYSVGEYITVTWTNYNGFPSGEDYIHVEYWNVEDAESLQISDLGTAATSDNTFQVPASAAGDTIQIYVYTSTNTGEDRTYAITQGRPWPRTVTVSAAVPEFPVGTALLLPLAVAVYLLMRRRSASRRNAQGG